VYEQAAPGKDWKKGTSYSAKGYTNNSHTIKFEYNTNHGSEVAQYYVSLSMVNNTYTPTLHRATANNGNYLAKQLYKTLTKDENWKPSDGVNHTTEEFKNKQGQVLLKRTYNNQLAHDTYYVYDDFGNLIYVLAPKMEASTATIATIISKLDALGYQYKYDQRNRLVEKKIPGKGWKYIVYDVLDRPVATQDPLLRGKKQWLFTKYDALGRTVYTGVFNSASTREVLQNQVTGYPLFENRNASTVQVGDTALYYSNQGFPSSVAAVYGISYYDSYPS
ncbi:MAG: type IV secretion protein Rhs, partial [Psychromonas sp.]|nr:type IV secretion protein Rhs [Psychromonas sp.]